MRVALVSFDPAWENKEKNKGACEQFIKKAVDEGLSEKKARAAADKLIGATLDVGHMNMLRKYVLQAK